MFTVCLHRKERACWTIRLYPLQLKSLLHLKSDRSNGENQNERSLMQWKEVLNISTIEFAGKKYEVDEDGYLQEPDKWSEEFAQPMRKRKASRVS